MDVFALTRKLIDIESTTGMEAAVGEALVGELTRLGYNVERMPVEDDRFNVWATHPQQGNPQLALSTHMDTVPPFIPSSETPDRIYGRGSCDAKGIIVAQIAAAEKLKDEDVHVGLLFLVGEERDSQGAQTANQQPRGVKFLINGEPTENKLAIASKGTLRVELVARGRMAHSAYPELGESAIEKLLDALQEIRKLELPGNPKAGPCTLNIGQIEGGRAPNVISDHAVAQLLFRLVGPAEELRRQITQAAGSKAKASFKLEIPYMELGTVPGIETMVAAFTTDIPALTNWGKPLLIGPGSIHVAHTEREYIEKKQLLEAIDLYVRIARELLARA
ncbi:MAG: M20/M25/M40 family metallo-hydrolase [Candidatus Korobacteraceae bacterium]|jgi:acetylornithine deacetylase/succinyl-diaminopimelate desuccinylase-like protein